MGQAGRSGADTTVERVVVGRRTAEQELDLIGLIEAEAPEAERARPLPPSPLAVPAPVGEPTNREMVQAVRDWIESAIKPKAEGHAKFEAVVAMNALGIVIQIGRAACRERVCQYVENPVVYGTLKKKTNMQNYNYN